MVDIGISRMIKKLLWYPGLTKYRELEWSNILHDVAVVSKRYRPEDDQRGVGIGIGTAMENIPIGTSLGFSLSRYETHEITFHGKETTFTLDNEELYNSFRDGDRARVAYRNLIQLTYDYVSPDFNTIQLIDITPLGHYQFVGAEKLEYG